MTQVINETKSRSIQRVVNSIQTLEGAGFVVRRPFPTNALMDFDPFLLLDEMGPVDLQPGEAKGAPDHPHRGFETVTYILDGKLMHGDSQGNQGKLGQGDVQWMTAGAGVVHSEMPDESMMRDGGKLHGFQLWVNLPRRDKMMNPRYQEIPSASIPVGESEDGLATVHIIAGEALGTQAVIDTRTPIMYLHYTLQPGGKVEQAVPADFNIFAYVVDGQGQFGDGDQSAHEGQMIMFAQDGGTVKLSNPATNSAPLNVLLIGGVPLGEPVARYGPFVMNTQSEIYQAFRDYESGKMGSIKATVNH